MEIIYNDLINKKNIYHSNENMSRFEGLTLLIDKEKDYDIITYNDETKLLFLNIGVLKANKNGNFYYDYEIDRDSDIIDNIDIIIDDLNVKLSYIIGLDEYELKDINEFLYIASVYNSFKLRIIFNEIPIPNKEIIIKSRKYLLKSELRQLLMRNKIITDSIIYIDGCTRKKD